MDIAVQPIHDGGEEHASTVYSAGPRYNAAVDDYDITIRHVGPRDMEADISDAREDIESVERLLEEVDMFAAIASNQPINLAQVGQAMEYRQRAAAADVPFRLFVYTREFYPEADTEYGDDAVQLDSVNWAERFGAERFTHSKIVPFHSPEEIVDRFFEECTLILEQERRKQIETLSATA